MPWSIDEKGTAVVKFSGPQLETLFRSEAEQRFPQVANYPEIRAVVAERIQPGNVLELTIVFSSD